MLKKLSKVPRRLALLGVGLIGGSFAGAMRQAFPGLVISAYDRDELNLALARQLGVIDSGSADLAQVVDQADLVMLAVPVGQMPGLMAELAPLLNPATVITDVGSTKTQVVEAARQYLGAALSRFVPGHPIAGAEASGVRAAQADLFRERTVVLTPLPETDPYSLDWVRDCWLRCGAQVEVQTVRRHDEIFAAVSHLPHLLSFALVHEIAERPDAATLFRFAAGGFRDFTRIAASNAQMWRDISLGNREILLEELARYRVQIDQLSHWLEEQDGASLEAYFQRARQARREWQN